jgi:hypothetical protein
MEQEEWHRRGDCGEAGVEVQRATCLTCLLHQPTTMPIAYRIDQDRRLVLTRAWGVLTDADILDHKEHLAKDPHFQAPMVELSDLRSVERLDVTTEGVKAMVAHDAGNVDRVAGHRLALVVGSDEVFGMARMYGLRRGADGDGVGVFRDMAEAEAWLSVGQPKGEI